MAKADQELHGLLTAIDPKSISPFFKRGGKLLTYQGWSDQDISPLASVNFYKSMPGAVGDATVSSSMRLFMVPGMGPLRRRRGPEHLRHDGAARAVGREGAGAGAGRRVTQHERQDRPYASAVPVSAGGALHGHRKHRRSGELHLPVALESD